MPVQSKKATEPVECGVNKYVDFGFGTSHGNWHATEKAAKNDKKAVEASAENEAWVAAQQEAVAVAERKCPRKCPNKSSEDDPDPPQPWYRPADVYESMPEHDLANGWRWHAKAKVEYQVLFSCGPAG